MNYAKGETYSGDFCNGYRHGNARFPQFHHSL